MTHKNYKSFIYFIIGVYLLTPCLLLALNYSVDPNQRYRFSIPKEDLTKLSRSQDLLLILPDNYDDRALKKKFIEAAMEPAVVVMGGSRVLNIQPEMFNAPWSHRFINLAMQAGTIRDYVALWQALKDEKFRPQFVFLCVEEQSLNGPSQNDRFLSIYDSYSAFYNEGMSFRTKLLGLTTGLKDLISLQTTLASIKQLSHQNRSVGQLISKADHDRSVPAVTSSFSMIYPKILDTRPSEEVHKVGKENGVGEHKVFEMWNRKDRTGYNHLIALIRDMQKEGGTPILIGMPYHPAAYEVIVTSDLATQNMHYFVSELKELAKNENVPFFNAITENLDFKNEDFMDGVHLKRMANYTLFKRANDFMKLTVISENYKADQALA